jgi:hypothetical protein
MIENTNFYRLGFIFEIMTLSILYVPVILIILIIRSYTQSMFSNQGYLTMTLPVKTGAILCSKTLVSFIWFNTTLVVGFFSLLLALDNSLVEFFIDPYNISMYGALIIFINLLAFMCMQAVFTAITASRVSSWRAPRAVQIVLLLIAVAVVFGILLSIMNAVNKWSEIEIDYRTGAWLLYNVDGYKPYYYYRGDYF